MMKKLIAALAALSLLAVSVPVFAQADVDDEPETQLIDMEGLILDGETVGPKMYWKDHTERAEFGPILRVHKSFVDKVHTSVQSGSLD
jgi:hypothetical protein